MNRHYTMMWTNFLGFGLLVAYGITSYEMVGVIGAWIGGMGLGMVLMDIWIDSQNREIEGDGDEDYDEGGDEGFDVTGETPIPLGKGINLHLTLYPSQFPSEVSGVKVGQVEMDETQLPTSDEVPL